MVTSLLLLVVVAESDEPGVVVVVVVVVVVAKASFNSLPTLSKPRFELTPQTSLEGKIVWL